MPHLYLLSALGQRIDRVPALRRRLWQVEGGILARLWQSLGQGDPDTVSDRGRRLGGLVGPAMRKHRHVLLNLATAFPHWPQRQRERVAAAIWGNMGRVLLEYTCLDRICDPAEGRIRTIDLGGLDLVRRSGRPGIFVAPHLANWNVLPVAATSVGIPLTVVYRRQSNPALEHLMTSWRGALRCGFLEVGEASRGMVRELRAGTSIGLLMDQRNDRGVPVPFFGMPAETTPIPARVAVRLGVPLIPARIERRGGARFVITIHRPVEPASGLEPEAAALELTARVNALFAGWIAAEPEQWLCVKRRWPWQRVRALDGRKVRKP